MIESFTLTRREAESRMILPQKPENLYLAVLSYKGNVVQSQWFNSLTKANDWTFTKSQTVIIKE